jgi:hypothetical protein
MPHKAFRTYFIANNNKRKCNEGCSAFAYDIEIYDKPWCLSSNLDVKRDQICPFSEEVEGQ